VKLLTKQLGVTINDVVICALSAALRTFFMENGDSNKNI